MLASNQQTSELLYGHEKSEDRRQELKNKSQILGKFLENRVFREKIFLEASKLQEQQIIQRNHLF